MKLEISLAAGLILLAAPALAGGAKSPPPRAAFDVVPLVSDQAGMAPNTDPNLVNAWGISHAPGAAPLWIADNGTNKSTLYDPNTGAIQSLVVNIPLGAPTGTVYAPPGEGFQISEGSAKGDSEFLFDTESGAIEGWSASVDVNNAIVAVDNSAKGSVYKGLAIDVAGKQLFAADFTNNQVQIFDNKFNQTGAFTDTALPKRFAPFNVALLNGKLYVAFAKREKHGGDEIDKKGLGYVDVFDTSGKLQQRLVSNGRLDAPWGMTIAPSGFGKFAGALLVGNFGNGKINVFDPNTGDSLGMLRDASRNAIKIDGLWGLDAGPGSNVTFAAGPDGETHGLLGHIAPSGK